MGFARNLQEFQMKMFFCSLQKLLQNTFLKETDQNFRPKFGKLLKNSIWNLLSEQNIALDGARLIFDLNLRIFIENQDNGW